MSTKIIQELIHDLRSKPNTRFQCDRKMIDILEALNQRLDKLESAPNEPIKIDYEQFGAKPIERRTGAGP